MLERFTDPARMMLAHANEEARSWNHDSVHTEHLLLALLRVPASEGATALVEMGGNLNDLRRDVERRLTRGDSVQKKEALGQAPQVRVVLGRAIEEAGILGHGHVGTEHLLLAMLWEESSMAGRVLRENGVELVRARSMVGSRTPAMIATGKPALSKDALDAVGRGIHAARALGHSPVEPGHLLLGLLLHAKGVTAEILARHGVTIEDVQSQVLKRSERGDRKRGE